MDDGIDGEHNMGPYPRGLQTPLGGLEGSHLGINTELRFNMATNEWFYVRRIDGIPNNNMDSANLKGVYYGST